MWIYVQMRLVLVHPHDNNNKRAKGKEKTHQKTEEGEGNDVLVVLLFWKEWDDHAHVRACMARRPSSTIFDSSTIKMCMLSWSFDTQIQTSFSSKIDHNFDWWRAAENLHEEWPPFSDTWRCGERRRASLHVNIREPFPKSQFRHTNPWLKEGDWTKCRMAQSSKHLMQHFGWIFFSFFEHLWGKNKAYQ